tara:strand:- start:279 stop:437 length:159 start_codon:yes stop_codon:yes gene_type:complete
MRGRGCIFFIKDSRMKQKQTKYFFPSSDKKLSKKEFDLLKSHWNKKDGWTKK